MGIVLPVSASPFMSRRHHRVRTAARRVLIGACWTGEKDVFAATLAMFDPSSKNDIMSLEWYGLVAEAAIMNSTGSTSFVRQLHGFGLKIPGQSRISLQYMLRAGKVQPPVRQYIAEEFHLEEYS